MARRELRTLDADGPLPSRRSMVKPEAGTPSLLLLTTPVQPATKEKKLPTFAVGDVVTDPRATERKFAVLEAELTDPRAFKLRWRMEAGGKWVDAALGRDGDGYQQATPLELARLYEKVAAAPTTPAGFVAGASASRKRVR